MTATGDMDRRIQFQRAVLRDSPLGRAEDFAPHGTPVWGSRRDVTDVERARAAEVQASVTTRFVVRWSAFAADLTPKDRLTCDGREYDITGIREVGARRTFLEITASARADR